MAEGSNQEVALSELAAVNASRQDVKDFAQMMIRDHGMLNSQLADLASRKGVDIADAVAKGQKKGVESLEKKQGADFDQAYLKDMVSGHDATLKAFHQGGRQGEGRRCPGVREQESPDDPAARRPRPQPAAGGDVRAGRDPALPMNTANPRASAPVRAGLAPSQEEISRRAYALWQDAGSPENTSQDHWLQAEGELSAGAAPAASTTPYSASGSSSVSGQGAGAGR